MKTLKRLFILTLFLNLFTSCTNFEELDTVDDSENIALVDTGDEGEEVDETEKD